MPAETRAAGDVINVHLAPHLREVCALLATGLLRLRRRAAEDLNHDARQAPPPGENSLHFTADQSVHADPLERASA